ncbi:MAG TPA: phosphoadenylyl-sulfate reductase [Burkholderiales bacterium]|nr:phosphoadenylyl-sulfate reductase [Burkholderiales bacterium]
MGAKLAITSDSALALTAKVQALEALLAGIAHTYSPAVLASSLSIEDMVITDAILRNNITIGIFTLDTGRMHQDTLDVVGAIRDRYGVNIEVLQPQQQAVTQYVKVYGRDALYESVDLRKACCEIRKVEPLKRALAGKKAWITGLRRAQAVTRDDLQVEEYDELHSLKKFNPLADWSEEEVWAYLQVYEVPYNRLFDQGYRSVGCAPCTRPTTAGEDVRAGRWWWEEPESKECGLHVGPDGRLVRSKGA